MKKLLYLFSAVALTLTSCSSDDDSNNSSGTLLTKIIETYDDGTVETTDFEYNGNKIVSISSDLDLRDETIYTYTGDLITTEEYFFDDGIDSFEEVIDYEYDSNNRLIKSIRTDQYGDIETDNFTYNSNGTVSFTTTANSTTIASGIIYFNGNQPYKKEITENPGTAFEVSWVEESTFDLKVSPFANVTGFYKIIIGTPSYTRGYPGIVGNSLDFSIDNTLEERSTYTYNGNNMPASETYIDFDNGDNNSTLQYFYN
jgi:hypothetical protein